MNKMIVASSILAIAALVLTTQMANTAFATARGSGGSPCQGGPDPTTDPGPGCFGSGGGVTSCGGGVTSCGGGGGSSKRLDCEEEECTIVSEGGGGGAGVGGGSP